MLENLNDYLAMIAVIGVLFLALGIAFYFINLKWIEKNVRREVKYYDFQRKHNEKR